MLRRGEVGGWGDGGDGGCVQRGARTTHTLWVV